MTHSAAGLPAKASPAGRALGLADGGHGRATWQDASRLVGKISLAVIGQLLISALHFGLNVTLVRMLPPGEYGMFAFAFALAMLTSSISNALVATPLAVYTSGLDRAAPRAAIEASIGAANLLLLVGAFLVSLLLAGGIEAAEGEATGWAGLAAAAFATAYAGRFATRSLALARHRGNLVLWGDLTFVGGSLAALAAMAFQLPLSATMVLVALMLGNLAAAAADLAALRVKPQPALRRSTVRRYRRRIWPKTRWWLLGSVTAVLQAQAHALLVSLWLGAAAFAPLAAGQVAFSPVRVVIFAWQSALRPEFARAVAGDHRRRLVWLVLLSSGLLGLGVAGLAALLALFWEPLAALLYGGNYEPDRMVPIVALNGAIVMCTALSTGPSLALQALGKFKGLALATVGGSLASMAVVALALAWSAPVASLMGVLLAELLVLVMVIWMLRAWLRS